MRVEVNSASSLASRNRNPLKLLSPSPSPSSIEEKVAAGLKRELELELELDLELDMRARCSGACWSEVGGGGGVEFILRKKTGIVRAIKFQHAQTGIRIRRHSFSMGTHSPVYSSPLGVVILES